MIRFILIFLTGICVSFFYFPVEFVFLPGINTKMMEAVVGLACVAFELIRRRSLDVSRGFLLLVGAAAAVSIVSFLSITINQTPDTSYVTYLVSFSVWLSAAFAVCYLIKAVHGRIDVQLVLNYLVAVCLAQCIFALWIDSSPSFARWVDTVFRFGQVLIRALKRLYGIGAMLDVAGLRFSVVLVGLAFYLAEVIKPLQLGERILYIVCFFAISVIGNMIARTTLVGTGLGAAVIVVCLFMKPNDPNASNLPVFFSWFGLLVVGLVTCIVLYNTNPNARNYFRFAFEGFFSLAEKGYWEVSSNEKLKTMVVWPETIHTWIIGDGYFENSRNDINYLGESTELGFYMGTDVGYLRFIFYFGIIGLIPMMSVIIISAALCIHSFQKERFLFILALAVGLIVWLKVSTDVFLFFALFLSCAALQKGKDNPVVYDAKHDQ
jgi:hypothetical protein